MRAAQTAKRFKKLSGLKVKVRETPLLDPLADFRILSDFLESAEETLLLVGHPPSLSHLGSYLLTRKSDAALLDLKQGGMACLESGNHREKSQSSGLNWQLSWQLRPRMLKQNR